MAVERTFDNDAGSAAQESARDAGDVAAGSGGVARLPDQGVASADPDLIAGQGAQREPTSRRQALLRLVPPLFGRGPEERTEEMEGAPRVRRKRRLTTFGSLLDRLVFSSLTRRIVVLNLAALLVLLTGFLYLNQYRTGLVEARVAALRSQGQIIAAAIAASASVDTNTLTIDPEALLELEAGETIRPTTGGDDLDFAVNPERVAPVLRRLIVPTRTRARLYDAEAALLLDSQHLYDEGQVLRYELPPLEGGARQWLADAWRSVSRIWGSGFERYREEPGGSGSIYGEVRVALQQGVPATALRERDDGTLVVSVAVPIQRFRSTLGVLLLSSQGQTIDDILSSERQGILRVFGVAMLVTAILSGLLASTIAQPLRDLSRAATRVRSAGVESREEIPDYSEREDEIGDLSASLRAMTAALYDRIDAIERFAGDVSHELKNPLTSLRSAIETLPLAKTDESRQRLIDIINHDVRRLNRLISDIADASRLDAELALQNADPVNLTKLVTDLVDINRQICSDTGVEIELDIDDDRRPYLVFGHDLRIGQVITNLIENARSFVPDEDGRIVVRMTRVAGRGDLIDITVSDNGPGVPDHALERIFERFYTDRPEGESFGQNSGLGLSISRQIIEAHGGELTAGNVPPDQGTGAVFRIRLPATGRR